MYKKARTRSQDCGRFVDEFLSFLFANKGLGKLYYNDTKDVNKRASYCIIHELLHRKALCLMSALDDNPLFSFVMFYPYISSTNPPRFERRVPQPYLLPCWDWPIEGRGRSRALKTSRHIEFKLLSVYLWEEAYLTLCCTMVQRVRTAA
jgi:hypothetical protein